MTSPQIDPCPLATMMTLLQDLEEMHCSDEETRRMALRSAKSNLYRLIEHISGGGTVDVEAFMRFVQGVGRPKTVQASIPEPDTKVEWED